MLVTFLQGEAISNHVLNQSHSKQMYSFPKSPRFKVLNKSSSSTFIYNLPSSISKRKAFIGYGKKSDFTKEQKSIDHIYNIVREFDDVNHSYIEYKNAPHYSFGLSKEHMLKRVINGKTSEIKLPIPGPGKYNFLKPFGSFSPRFSMGVKLKSREFNGNSNSPGPARYKNNIILNNKGSYFLSNFPNSSLYSMGKEKRFIVRGKETPAPNQYKLGYLINGTGNIYNSIYKSSTSKTFGRKYKSIFGYDNGFPGPGAYTTFSEFGIYKSKNALKNYNHLKWNHSVNGLQRRNWSLNGSLNSTDIFTKMINNQKKIPLNQRDENNKVNLRKLILNGKNNNDMIVNNNNKNKKNLKNKKNENDVNKNNENNIDGINKKSKNVK